jgi:release factor glutamine methyltransferase
MIALTAGEALQAARQSVDPVDARALLTYVTGRQHAELAAHPEASLSAVEAERYSELVARRAAGEPVAYLTGQREFYGLLFHVTPAVLIPRPETELLVDLALERLAPHPAARILDLGTGSACIAITLASKCSHCTIVAVDQSVAALAVAARNRVGHAVANVELVRSDWFSELRGHEPFDMIVANPPYVAARDPHLQQGDLRFEPRAALEAGPEGLEAIRTIVSGSVHYLRRDGWLLFEHGWNQGERARALLAETGFSAIFSARDLAGVERVTGGRLTPAPRRR